ncbi:MAG: two-component regulator propeller domain-containing protein [Paludibacter sp.]|nr:two-component regulator propeller domain-containing protein [Paludibacter sp.]
MYKRVFILYSLLLLFLSVSAIDVIPIKQDNNLSTNSISAFVQGNLGFMWIGTDAGLECFDGYSAYKQNLFKNQDSTVNITSRIESLYKDYNGNIWISSTDGIFTYKVTTQKVRKILDVRVFSIVEDFKLKGLWLATPNGLFLISYNGKVKIILTRQNGLSSEQITSLAKDREGNIWVGTERGLDMLSLNTKNQISVNHIIPDIHISFLTIDSFDYIWYVNREKTYMIKRNLLESGKSMPTLILKNIDTSTIYPTENEIWIGTKGDGIIRFSISPNGHKLNKEIFWVDKENENELKNAITVFFKDNYSNIWVGTKDGMYMILRNEFLPFRHLKYNNKKEQTPVHNTISGLVCDNKNRVWLATAKGLDCFIWTNRLLEKFEFLHFKDISDTSNIVNNNKIQSLVLVDENTLMLSTKNDIKLFDINKKHFYANHVISDSLNKNQLRFVRSFYKDHKDNIYMAFATGNLAVYNTHDNTIKPIILNNDDSWGITQDENDCLWIASGKDGLFKLAEEPTENGQQWKIEHYSEKLIKNNYAVSIFCDHNNMLWVGTSGGLFLYKHGDKFEEFPLPYMENNSYIEAVIEDLYNNIWVFGIKGIYKIGANRDIKTIQYYEIGNEDIARLFYVFGRCLNNEGWVFSGGTNGLVFFDPAMVVNKSYKNIPVISSFKILNKDVSLRSEKTFTSINTDKTIQLDYRDYLFSFDISSLYYPNPFKIRYAYKLEGFDKDWIYLPSNNRTIVFTNVPPGNYRLLLKATDASGLWSGIENKINVIISPPWWNTWWSWIFYFMLFVIIIYFIYNYVLANYKFRHQEEVNQWKFRFFINLSHSFNTPLNMLQTPIQYIINNFDSLSGDEIKKMLFTAYRNIKRLKYLVSQLIEFRKIDLNKSQLNLADIDIIPFIHSIYEIFEDIALSKKINFTLNTNGIESMQVVCDPDKIEIVIFNLLSNAFKYTSTGGSVSIDCMPDKYKNRVWISVMDNGRGISPAELPYIFDRFRNIPDEEDPLKGQGIGLSIAKEFIEMHHAKLSVESSTGGGSTFKFFILLDSSHWGTSAGSIKKNISTLDFTKKNIEIEQPETAYRAEEREKNDLPVIYLLDVDFDLSSFIRYYLKESFNFNTFSEGKNLLNSLNKAQLPELIVLDIVSIEKQEGVALCKKIKSDPTMSYIPVILTSSIPETDMEIIAYDAGADAYIIKPYEVAYLKTRITQLLRSRKELKERVKQELIINPKEVKVTSSDDIFLANLMNIIEENISNVSCNIDDLAEKLNISRSVLYRRINNISGLSPIEFIKSVKLKRAAQLLETASISVAEVSYKVGFQDARYFSTCFKKQFGISPKAYSKTKSKKA